MNKFKTIDELRSVKGKLYFRKEELEQEIKNNIDSIKHSLTPSGIFDSIKSSINKPGASAPDKEPGILNNVAATAMDILVNDIFLRRTSYVKRFVMSYLIRLLGPTVMHNAGPVVTRLLKKSGLLGQLGNKGSQNGKPAHNEPVYTHGIG